MRSESALFNSHADILPGSMVRTEASASLLEFPVQQENSLWALLYIEGVSMARVNLTCSTCPDTTGSGHVQGVHQRRP